MHIRLIPQEISINSHKIHAESSFGAGLVFPFVQYRLSHAAHILLSLVLALFKVYVHGHLPPSGLSIHFFVELPNLLLVFEVLLGSGRLLLRFFVSESIELLAACFLALKFLLILLFLNKMIGLHSSPLTFQRCESPPPLFS